MALVSLLASFSKLTIDATTTDLKEIKHQKLFCAGLHKYLEQNFRQLELDIYRKCSLCSTEAYCLWHTAATQASLIREMIFDLTESANMEQYYKLLMFICCESSVKLNEKDCLYIYANRVKWLNYVLVHIDDYWNK
jgi:hypothetical protein